MEQPELDTGGKGLDRTVGRRQGPMAVYCECRIVYFSSRVRILYIGKGQAPVQPSASGAPGHQSVLSEQIGETHEERDRPPWICSALPGAGRRRADATVQPFLVWKRDGKHHLR